MYVYMYYIICVYICMISYVCIYALYNMYAYMYYIICTSSVTEMFVSLQRLPLPQLLVHMLYHMSTGWIVCRGSHTVARAFNAALTRTMFPLSDTWGISVEVTVPLVTPPRPGRNTAIWSVTAYLHRGLHPSQPLYLVWRPSHYPPSVDAPGWGGCHNRNVEGKMSS